jgi:hypothetical protein
MPNVIDFREKAPRIRGSRLQRQPANLDADISELVCRIVSLQSKAKGEIDNAVMMLDLAAQHARQIAGHVCDPKVKSDFDEHVAIIDQLLRTARKMALKL